MKISLMRFFLACTTKLLIKITLIAVSLNFLISCVATKPVPASVPAQQMERIFDEIKTPYKFGIVFKHPDTTKMIDSPTIFRWKRKWRMTYIVFDGRGYETWMAESDNLLDWRSVGKIMSFTDSGWDAHQKAGYLSLIDTKWGGSIKPRSFNGKYWMSYLGGSVKGYEAGQLGVGMAYTDLPAGAGEWTRLPHPVLSPQDKDARWFDNKTIFKSSVVWDKKKHTGKPFVMYYNASGDTAKYESIGMAISDNMINWERYGEGPVISQFTRRTICGDAQIVKIGNVYVMFYFGAFWNGSQNAYERFACSYDLIHWTDWKGEDLIKPSEPYDKKYAHKPLVFKWKKNVYHFYNAVGDAGRVIALATSVPIEKQQ